MLASNTSPKRSAKKVLMGGFLPLTTLADFLNFDFSAVKDRSLDWLIFESMDQIPDTVHHLLTRNPDGDWVQEAQDLQRELIQYLQPLTRLGVQSTQPAVIQDHLVQLVAKVNSLKLPRLSVESGDHKWHFKGQYGQQEEEREVNFPNPYHKDLGPGRGILVFGKTKWIIRETRDDTESPQHYLYGAISENIRSGDFPRLKNCLECQKFFVAADLKQRHCTPEHREAYHDRGASDRVKESRQQAKAKELRRRAKADLEAKVHEFKRFLEGTDSMRGPSKVGVVIKYKIPGGWKTVLNWSKELKEGCSEDDLWKKLPVEIKDLLVNEVFQSRSIVH